MATTTAPALDEKLFVGRDTAARMLDVSTRTIDDAIRAGELEVYRLGRRVLIQRDSLIQLANRVPIRKFQERHQPQKPPTPERFAVGGEQ